MLCSFLTTFTFVVAASLAGVVHAVPEPRSPGSNLAYSRSIYCLGFSFANDFFPCPQVPIYPHIGIDLIDQRCLVLPRTFKERFLLQQENNRWL